MTTHYCHNCKYHAELPDATYCAWCLEFFYSNGRLPNPEDKLPDNSTVARLNRALDTLISEG